MIYHIMKSPLSALYELIDFDEEQNDLVNEYLENINNKIKISIDKAFNTKSLKY